LGVAAALSLSSRGIRILNCVLAIFVPVLVLQYGERTSERTTPRYVPWMAAALCATSPLVNLLGTSAQQETLFTLLVIGVVWSIDMGRFALAGGLLAIASLIRYEAWGGVALLVGLRVITDMPVIVRRSPDRIVRAYRIPWVVTIPSLIAIAGWFLARRISEGAWFAFLRELYRYTVIQRGVIQRAPVADLLWFPVTQPMFVFGGIMGVLFIIGIRRAWRPSYIVPLGMYLFLLGAYLFKGALGSARYYEALTPFVAIAAAHGIRAIDVRRKSIAPFIFAAASWQLCVLSIQLCRWTWPDVDVAARSALGQSITTTSTNVNVPHGSAMISTPRASRETPALTVDRRHLTIGSFSPHQNASRRTPEF
jgi:hypothetical protein